MMVRRVDCGVLPADRLRQLTGLWPGVEQSGPSFVATSHDAAPCLTRLG